MKRLLWSALLVALLGPVAFGQGRYMGSVYNKNVDGVSNGVTYMPQVPNLVGPWGQPVEMKMPYAMNPPTGDAMARAMMSQSVPLELAGPLQQHGGGLQQVQCGPNGCSLPGLGAPQGMGMPGMGMPGMGMPGMGMPGMGMGGPPPGMGGPPPGMGGPPGRPVSLHPGYTFPQQGLPPGMPLAGGPLGGPGAVAAVGALTGRGGPGGPGGPGPFQAARTQIRFVGPTGMRVSWYAPGPNGQAFTAEYLEAPGRYNFVQSAIYRLKLTNLPNRTNLTALYPTLEVLPATAKTATFLAHSSVPISFTEEDIEQVVAGNFLVKVIYLPDPQFQDLAATGPDEVVSTRLEPGVDPIREATRRGSLLAIVRLGNSDLEAPNTPAMDAPPPGYNGPPRGPIGPGGHGIAPVAPVAPAGPGGAIGLPGLPARPLGGVPLGAPGPNLTPNFPAAQGPQGLQRPAQPYLAPSPIPGLPQAVQGSGPPPVVAPPPRTPIDPPAAPMVPNKTTSFPGGASTTIPVGVR